MWRGALATFVSASVEALTAWLDQEYVQPVNAVSGDEGARAMATDGDELVAASALLGITLPVTLDEIRAAFRERVKSEMRSGAFHDHGGDATDEHAQRLIAAKNLLIEHATEVCRG
jgi:hypothetical protein